MVVPGDVNNLQYFEGNNNERSNEGLEETI